MHLRKTHIVVILLLLLPWASRAQTATVTMIGTVTDEQTGEPLPFANVYVNNSSIGTTTDEKGRYTLRGLRVGNLDMAVSYVGYAPIRHTLRFELPGAAKVLFKMRQGVELEKVVVSSRTDWKWKLLLKIVTQELLGLGRLARRCKILNPEVLRIWENDEGHILAESASPLQIENRALGYLIYQELSEFDYFNSIMYYGGNTRFELLTPENEKEEARWRANRIEAYQGSLKHLLTSMVADSLLENGFRVFQEIPDSLRVADNDSANYPAHSIERHLHTRIKEVRGADLIQAGELPTERRIVSATKLEVFDLNKRGRSRYSDMPYAQSAIHLPQGYAVITPLGWVVVPMGLEISGDLSSDRFATLLPADWVRE